MLELLSEAVALFSVPDEDCSLLCERGEQAANERHKVKKTARCKIGHEGIKFPLFWTYFIERTHRKIKMDALK
ncbi:MAG: hypothetical protein EOP04_25745 [Proteobacteria bacterium]|nr:MAG: hypothetical protein EOP04_25745 [Pseudomonadota bacterium]